MENTLYIHVIEPSCTEELVQELLGPEPEGDGGEPAEGKRAGRYSGWAVVRAAPSLRIGVLPWFAATLAGDPGTVPAPCEAVLHLFGGGCRAIDEALVAAVADALCVDSHPLCATARPEEAEAFLRQYMGKLALAHTWME
jgi:hypothetical protein